MQTRFEAWVHDESGADTPVQTADHAVIVEAASVLAAATTRAADWWMECAVIPARLVVIVKDAAGACWAFEATPEIRPTMRELAALPENAVTDREPEDGHGPTEPAPRAPWLDPNNECSFHCVRDKDDGHDKLLLMLLAQGESVDGKLDASQAKRVFYVFKDHSRARAFTKQLLEALAQIPEPS